MSTDSSDGSARRRGRPQRLPEDRSPMHSGVVGCDQRTAWLLTTCRILGPDPVLARRDGFIKALAGRGVHVDSSRVSRWESGLHPLPIRVAATYESVLGLTEGSLVAVVAGLRRAFGNGSPAKDGPAWESDLSDGDVDRLLALTESGRAHGGQWLRLAGQLNRYERVYLRKRDWQDLCGQLVSELAASVGVGYVRRYEAAASLIRHPRAQRHLTRALGSFVTHPDTQVVTPVLNLLAEITDAAASDLVLRMLGSDHRDLRRAAASVAAVKVARGHFDAEALKHLEPHVVGSLRRGESLDGRLDFFDLAVQLPEDCWDRIQPAVRNRRAFDLVTRSRQGGELVPWGQASAVVNEMASKIQVADAVALSLRARPDAAAAAARVAAARPQGTPPPCGAAARRESLRAGRLGPLPGAGEAAERPARCARVDGADAGRPRRPTRPGRPPGHGRATVPRSGRGRLSTSACWTTLCAPTRPRSCGTSSTTRPSRWSGRPRCSPSGWQVRPRWPSWPRRSRTGRDGARAGGSSRDRPGTTPIPVVQPSPRSLSQPGDNLTPPLTVGSGEPSISR